MKISEDFLSAWCPSTWISKAFAEYTLHAAEKATSVLDVVNDVASDTTIEEKIDDLVDEWDNSLSELSEECQKQLAVSGDFSGFNLNDPGTNELITSLLESKPELKTKIQSSGVDLYGEGFDIDQIIREDASALYTMDAFQAAFENTEVKTLIKDKVEALSNEIQVEPNVQLPIKEGYVALENLVVASAASFSAPSTDYKIHVPGYNIEGGELSSDIELSYEDITNTLKDTIGSATIIGQASAACASETLDETVENFENTIRQVIDVGSTKFSGQVAYIKDILVKTAGRADAFLATVYDKVGGVLFDQDEFTIPANTDISEFTGASPLFSLGLQGLAKGASLLGSTVIGAGLMIWKIIKTVIPAAFSKLGQSVWWLIDPADVEVTRQTCLKPVMDTLSVQGQASITLNHVGDGWDDMRSFLTGKFKTDNDNKWISIDTFTMQIMFKMRTNSGASNSVRIDYDYVLKPKILKHSSLVDRTLTVLQPGGHAYMVPMLQLLTNSGWAENFKFGTDGYYWNIQTTNEHDAFLGFNASRAAFFQMGALSLHSVAKQFNTKYSDVLPLSGYHPVEPYVQDHILGTHWFYVYNPQFSSDYTCERYSHYKPLSGQSIANTDWFEAATGYYKDQYDQVYYEGAERIVYDGSPYPNTWEVGSYADGVVSYILLFILQQYDKWKDPEEYFFLPYCRDSYSIDKGRFDVLTDTAIATKVDKFCSAVVTVVLVATITVLSAKVLRAIKTHKIAKWNARQGVLDNAMWNGAKLNHKQAKQYYKAKRKVAKLEGGSSGLAGSTPLIETVSKFAPTANDQPTAADIDTNTHDSILLKRIKQLITGS